MLVGEFETSQICLDGTALELRLQNVESWLTNFDEVNNEIEIILPQPKLEFCLWNLIEFMKITKQETKLW